MFNVAVILGAGNGTRMGIEKSKMLIDIGSKPVIQRSVEAFLDLPQVDEIIVVCRECDVEAFSDIMESEKVSFVIGGATRQESVKNAVEMIDECDYIIIHDGARPLVTQKAIINTYDKAVACGAAATGVQVKDTIKVVNDKLLITDTPDRSSLISIQTPQIFNFGLYKKAIAQAEKEGRDYTDDCQLVENIGQKVFAVLGDYDNIKITTKEDILHAESILKSRGEE